MRETYLKKIAGAFRERYGRRNDFAVPKIIKVVVNTGVGRLTDEEQRKTVQKFLAAITGQKPVPRKAKKAIAAFKTRTGQVIGYSATLRGARMYDFLDRFVHASLPRARDFKGIPPEAFDRNGNLTIGVKEHIVFPEMLGEDVRFIFGLEVTIVTSARRREEGLFLLRALGFPIQPTEEKASKGL